ncbi:MAG: lipid-A-disaccharide synthase [Deltaproteobacteria bacterium]|nr:lipid-A-disaccharide synthase [Deltaproteobacteria bacterium]
MKLFAVAGETSGDQHGGALLAELHKALPGLDVRGIGGPLMQAQGLKPVAGFNELQVHGIVEIVRHLPALYRLLWQLEETLAQDPPAALLTIDYPGFNLKLGLAARRLGIPVIHYSSPSIWAWRGGRIKTIARAVDLMLLLYPFEVPIYEQAGVEAVFTGHPLVGVEADAGQTARLMEALGGGDGPPVVGLMPGSRASELARNLPVMLQGARLIEQAGFRARWVVPVSPSLRRDDVLAMAAGAGVEVQALDDAFLPLLKCASWAVIASGTATLQAALAGLPFIVVYRVSPLTYFLARRLAYIKHVSLVNIVAGEEIVPELLQERFTPENIRDSFLGLATDQKKTEQMRQRLARVTAGLGEPGAYARAAQIIANRISLPHAP